MIKKLSLFSFIFLLSLYANTTAAYNGNTGVLETPNARILPDWSMRFFANQDTPFTYYGFGGTPLPFLEANFHVTQIAGIKGFTNNEGYGDYKDKSLNLKLLLKKESKYLPSIVLGGDDIWGTSLYTSKYFAFSKKISYYDFTLGYAKGRLGGEDLRKYSANSSNSGSLNNNSLNFLKDKNWLGGKPFGSIIFNATPSISLMAEYSPIDYSKDKTNPFLNGDKYELPSSDFNFGLKYKLNNKAIFTLSHQRGNQISFGFTYQFGFSRHGLFKHIPDPKWKADAKKLKEYKNLNEKELSNKLSNEVAAEKFSNVQTSVHKNKIWTEIDNPRYPTDLQAIGRATSVVDEVAPKKYDTIYMTLKKKGVPLKTVKVNRLEFDLYENENISDAYIKDAIIIENDVDKMYEEFSESKELYKTDIYGTEKFNYYIGPDLKNYLNAPSKPFATKLSVQAKFSYDIAAGLYLSGKAIYPLYNTIKDIPSIPMESNKLSIRSNMIDYYKYDDTQVKNLSLAYVSRAPFNSFAKAEIGYFDFAFAGSDLEWYKSFFNERFGFGLQYQYLYKRPVDDIFGVYSDLKYNTKFMNFNFLLSEKYDTHLGIKMGKFLAGDKGAKFEIARHYKNFSIGAFVTVTNSDDVFTSSQNRGYIDKGIYIKIPMDLFTYKNVKNRATYGLSPWTRDVGQYAETSSNLYQMNNSENNNTIMKKNINKFKE